MVPIRIKIIHQALLKKYDHSEERQRRINIYWLQCLKANVLLKSYVVPGHLYVSDIEKASSI